VLSALRLALRVVVPPGLLGLLSLLLVLLMLLLVGPWVLLVLGWGSGTETMIGVVLLLLLSLLLYTLKERGEDWNGLG